MRTQCSSKPLEFEGHGRLNTDDRKNVIKQVHPDLQLGARRNFVDIFCPLCPFVD